MAHDKYLLKLQADFIAVQEARLTLDAQILELPQIREYGWCP